MRASPQASEHPAAVIVEARHQTVARSVTQLRPVVKVAPPPDTRTEQAPEQPPLRHLRPAHDPIPALIPDETELCDAPRQLPVAVPDLPASVLPMRPRPRPEMIGRLALQAFEVVEGARSLAQLGNLVSFELCQHLAELRITRQEQQQIYQDHRCVLAKCGSIRSCSINEDVVEATVILHTASRVHAVAIRLEWAHNRWRASDLAIL